MKTTEAITGILAAYDLTQSYRDAAALVCCARNTVAHYVLARDAGELKSAPMHRSELIDPFRDMIEEWVDASRVGSERVIIVQTRQPLGRHGAAVRPSGARHAKYVLEELQPTAALYAQRLRGDRVLLDVVKRELNCLVL